MWFVVKILVMVWSDNEFFSNGSMINYNCKLMGLHSLFQFKLYTKNSVIAIRADNGKFVRPGLSLSF